jgi:hypothetical protein
VATTDWSACGWYNHANKLRLPFDKAKSLIQRCLDILAKKLKGFDPKQAVFNFRYNASTPELEAWLPSVVKAFRTGRGGINPLPHAGQTKLTCTGFGPGITTTKSGHTPVLIHGCTDVGALIGSMVYRSHPCGHSVLVWLDRTKGKELLCPHQIMLQALRLPGGIF